MKETITVLIVDDHPSMTMGLREMIQSDQAFEVIDNASFASEALKLTAQAQPDVIILDLHLGQDSGVALCAELKEKHPRTHIIIYTGYEYEPYFNRLVEHGASGLLSKSASQEDILALIHAVVRGFTILPLPVFRQLQLHRPQHEKRYWELDLTKTEQKILTMISNRETNSSIATTLSMSISSVENYMRKMYRKLGVESKTEALARIELDNQFNHLDE